jgi:hypothetical protein
MNYLARGILSKLVRPDRRSIAEWAEGNVIFPKSPQSRQFSRETAPWIIEPLESFRTCEATMVLKTTQGGGTALAETATVYTVKNRPTDMAIMAQTDKDAEKLFDDKFLQTLKASPATSAVFSMLPRYAVKKDSVALPNMKIQIHGPGEKSTQSATLGTVIIDEVWLLRLLAPSAIRSMLERQSAHPDPHMLCVSQAGEELRDKWGKPIPAEWEQNWRKGTQEIYSFKCPGCGEYFAPETEHFKCDPASKNPDGSRNWKMVQETTYLETPCCGHKIEDDDRGLNRRALSESGKYIATNPHAVPGWRSFRWSCWVVYWQKWGKNLMQFLLAVEARKRGDINPLKEWTMKKEATWWTHKAAEPPPMGVIDYGYKMSRGDTAGDIPEDVIDRLAGVDVQANRLEFVIRDFYPGGGSKKVFSGDVPSWGQLAAIMARYGVDRKKFRVFVDAGDRQQEVWRECKKRHWIPVVGRNERQNQMWNHVVNGQTVQRPWSPVRTGAIIQGLGNKDNVGGRKKKRGETLISYYELSDFFFGQWLQFLIPGGGLPWEYPNDASEDYYKSLDSMKLEYGPTGRKKYVPIHGRPNHKWDCEKYILAGAAMRSASPACQTIFHDLPEQTPDEEALEEIPGD